jgi:hypothetical protein
MRIDNHSFVDRLAHAQQAKDPFDLDFKVEALPRSNENKIVICSGICTVRHCGPSFCCTCR